MRKFNYIFLYVFFLLYIFSCSNTETSVIVIQKDDSLRNKMTYLDNSIIWTKNLDNLLKDNDNKEIPFEETEEFENLLPHEQREYLRNKEIEKQKNKPVLPEGLQELSYENRLFLPKNEPPIDFLYPELENFGSLDRSLLVPEVKILIENFVETINTKEFNIEYISPETRFLEPVFIEDFNYIDYIDSIIIGEPLIIQNEFLNEYQVPVRLITEKGYYNSLFFLVNIQDNYYVEQVNYGSLICG